jgi:hypothetical protein
MSWSFSGVGKPAALKRALDERSEGMGTDPAGDPKKNLSRFEFDHAKAHIGALLDAADQESAVSINAGGYASIDGDGVVTPKSLNVEIKQLGVIHV